METYQGKENDTAVIIYTSGTTGRPKGAELTHSNLLLNAIAMCDIMECQTEDVILIILPLFHSFGMTVSMNAAIYRGCSTVLLSRFDAETAFSMMEKHGVSIFAAVPTMYWGLLNCTNPKFNYALIAKNLKLCVSGGASLPVKVIQDFEKRFNVPIIESYGMSEGSPVVTFNQPKIGRKVGSIGTPLWGLVVKLIDADGKEVPTGEKGELLYRGHNVMKGYYKKPEETEKTLRNGWLHSGDMAIKDGDGFFYIVDRIKDMINRGGMKVYPREIEEVIIKHEAVSLVAVIGIPHEELGEEVKAYIVLKEDVSVTEIDIITWTKEQVASYKYPRHVEFIKALPTTATGKILKRELRK